MIFQQNEKQLSRDDFKKQLKKNFTLKDLLQMLFCKMHINFSLGRVSTLEEWGRQRWESGPGMWVFIYPFIFQCAGSGSGSVLISIGWIRIRIREGKNNSQRKKTLRNVLFSSAGYSLLGAGSFSCSFDVLYKL